MSTTPSAAATTTTTTASTPHTIQQYPEFSQAVINRAARTILGRSCDWVSRELGDQSLERFEDRDICVLQSDSLETTESGADEEEVTEEVERKLNAKLNCKVKFEFTLYKLLSVPFTPGGSAGVSYSKKGSDATTATSYIVAITVMHHLIVAFNHTPSPSRALKISRHENGFVYSTQLYAGYILLINAHCNSDKISSEGDMSVNMSLEVLKEALDLSGGGGRDRSRWRNRVITHLEIKTHGFGGYTVPTGKLTGKPGTLLEEIAAIRKDFNTFLPLSQYLATSPLCIKPYPPIPSFSTSTTATTPSRDFILSACNSEGTHQMKDLYEENDIRFYERLAEDIMGDLGLPESCKTSLEALLKNENDKKKNFSLGRILHNMHVIFPRTLAEIALYRQRSPTQNNVLITGRTGSGKSLIAGLRMGLEIKKDGRHYTFKESIGIHIPKVGKKSSETKGAAIYTCHSNLNSPPISLIDTAGFDDMGGQEADLCNAVAVSLATRLCPPQKMMVVMMTSVFEERGTDFIKRLDRLEKAVGDLNDDVVANALLWVFNDTKPENEDPIPELIPELITRLESEIKTYIPSSLFDKLKKFLNLMVDNEDSELDSIQNIPATNRLIRHIQTLKGILTRGNYIYVDILKSPPDQTTRDEIIEWENRVSQQRKQVDLTFNMEGLAGPRGFSLFRYSFMYMLQFFNGLTTQERTYMKALEEMESKIAEQTRHIHSLKTDAQNDTALIEELAVKLQSLIEKRDRETPRLQAENQTLETEKRQLQTSKKETYLETIRPTGMISRPFWPLQDSTAQTYPLSCDIKFPLLAAKTKLVPGKYIEKDTTDLKKGIYEAEFLPAWWGHKGDTRAAVMLYVERKYHPSTILRIANIDIQITANKSLIEKLKTDIQTCQKDTQRLLSLSEENRQISIGKIEQCLDILTNAYRTTQQHLFEHTSRLQRYENFRKLCADFLKEYSNIEHLEKNEIKTAREFLLSFDG